jgi:hypothetical protein
MERIINEFRVIETDDGFRIEIKGDKEKIRSFMTGFRGPRHWHRRHKRPWGFACGPLDFGFEPWAWMRAASCWGPRDAETEEGEEAQEVSSA